MPRKKSPVMMHVSLPLALPEYEELRRAAAKAGMPHTKLMRHLVLDGVEEILRPKRRSRTSGPKEETRA